MECVVKEKLIKIFLFLIWKSIQAITFTFGLFKHFYARGLLGISILLQSVWMLSHQESWPFGFWFLNIEVNI